jgi:hypothetical protein
MRADDIMQRYAARAGWSDADQLALALRYIENQDSNDAFANFLSEEAEADDGAVLLEASRDPGRRCPRPLPA